AGGDAFTRDVTEGEEKLPIGWDQVAIIAADGADRCVVITGFPTASMQARLRQQFALYLGGQIEIALQGGAFWLGEMIQTVANQRIGQPAVRFHGFVSF